mmetsp:Transcript_15521/g.25681  ORF Transcript_15521/g.25681 Transcript_15521/m.25681 type:complete len:359 (-) Transcript_15521:346-1422(-)
MAISTICPCRSNMVRATNMFNSLSSTSNIRSGDGRLMCSEVGDKDGPWDRRVPRSGSGPGEEDLSTMRAGLLLMAMAGGGRAEEVGLNSTRGRETVTVVPVPKTLFTSIWPPSISTIILHITNPRPVPPGSLIRSSRTLTKRENRFLTSDSRIPMPWSCTTSRSLRSAMLASTSTDTIPSFEYLTPFEMRLTRTCRTRLASLYIRFGRDSRRIIRVMLTSLMERIDDETIDTASSTTVVISVGANLTCTLPASIWPISNTSEMTLSRCSPDFRATFKHFSTSDDKSASRASCNIPRIPFRGVRISWLTLHKSFVASPSDLPDESSHTPRRPITFPCTSSRGATRRRKQFLATFDLLMA